MMGEQIDDIITHVMSQSKSGDLISIIIVNYNTEQETEECLTSLQNLQTDGFCYNLIVVDNGSKQDFTLPKNLQASQSSAENVEVIRTEANLGFTGGNNLGISHAVKNYNPEYFLLLNSDTVVKADFLIHLYHSLANNERAGLASSKIYFAPGYEFHQASYNQEQQGEVLWYAGGSIDWQNLLAFHRGVDEVDRGHFQQQTQPDFATGCSLLIKREVIEEVGILDKKYFLYVEDVDYSLRVQRQGYQVLFCPQSIVWHKNAGSSQGVGSKIHQYYQTRNRLLFFFKYGRLKTKLTALRLMLRLLIQGNRCQQKAVRDYLLGRFGKQPIV
jgi:hypothetical protein